MRSNIVYSVLLLVFATFIAAWTSEDHEVFRLRDEVASAEGDNVTFYDLLGIKPTATQDEINAAVRKKSRTLHPDKARQSYLATYSKTQSSSKSDNKKGKKPGVTVRKKPTQKELAKFQKEAEERYRRITIAGDVLKGPQRERYDHFLKNGFPKWRGTGYYYSRARPGLGTVLFGLFVMGGGAAHYGLLYLDWTRKKQRVEKYISDARRVAWGDAAGIPGLSDTLDGTGNGTATPPPQRENEDSMNWNRRAKRAAERENRKAGKSGKAAAKARNSGISTPVEASLTSGPTGAKKRVVAENGKVFIVDSAGNVFLEEESEDGVVTEYLVDVPKPTIYDTLLFRLPRFAYDQTLGRVTKKRAITEVYLTEEEVSGAAEDSDEKILTEATALNPNSEARKRKIKRAKT
ncbi:hypothetical protein M501DRAFT_907675, partial [Patellaria atrata CBS 101060]